MTAGDGAGLACRFVDGLRPCYMAVAKLCDVSTTTITEAQEFGFHPGDIIQEWLWDEDVDEDLRSKIQDLTNEDLVDEDYDSSVDGVIIWWRDGDDEDALADTIMDATSLADEGVPFWIITPKPGREGSTSPTTLQSAAKTAGMNAATPLTVSKDWNGVRLRAFGKGAERADRMERNERDDMR